MRHTSGRLALMSAIGGGFVPAGGRTHEGVDQGDGTYLTRTRHGDGRELDIVTKHGDGWQLGKFVSATVAGPWRAGVRNLEASDWWHVRQMLALHDPSREQPYCGGQPQRQARRLDGRERDILGRILRDIDRACRDEQSQQRLLSVISIEQEEVFRLAEIAAVLDARADD